MIHKWIQTFWAVKHDALYSQRLGHVFSGLGLAGPRGPRRRAAQVQLQRAHEAQVASVRQRRYHQHTYTKNLLLEFFGMCILGVLRKLLDFFVAEGICLKKVVIKKTFKEYKDTT